MENIKQLLASNQVEKAIELIKRQLDNQPDADELWYLLGKSHYKLGHTREALNSYLRAIELNPDSPAKGAYDMAIRVLDFYNKDMYNQ